MVFIAASLLVSYRVFSAVQIFTASPHDVLLPLPRIYWADLGLRLGGTLLSCPGPCCFSGQSPGQSNDSHGEVTCVWGNFRRSLLAKEVTEICFIFVTNYGSYQRCYFLSQSLDLPKTSCQVVAISVNYVNYDLPCISTNKIEYYDNWG
jgi:hypothetical protein